MIPVKANLTVYKGSNYSKVIRWESGPVIYKTITAVPVLAPCTLTVTGHGMPNGWRFAVQSVKGMTQLNAKKSPPVDSDYYNGTVIDNDTIEINSVNAMDFSAYTSGGVILYNTPVDLTGYTARMMIKDKVGGTELLSISSTAGIVISTTDHTIEISLDSTQTSGMSFSKAVYDLEVISSLGTVSRLLTGSIVTVEEVTT